MWSVKLTAVQDNVLIICSGLCFGIEVSLTWHLEDRGLAFGSAQSVLCVSWRYWAILHGPLHLLTASFEKMKFAIWSVFFFWPLKTLWMLEQWMIYGYDPATYLWDLSSVLCVYLHCLCLRWFKSMSLLLKWKIPDTGAAVEEGIFHQSEI